MSLEEKGNYFFKNREYSPVFGMFSYKEMLAFCAFTEQFGASGRTMQDRIRYRGFADWERKGIASICEKDLCMPYTGEKNFLSNLCVEKRNEFIAVLAENGMCANTTRHRFDEGNFKQWELIGFNELHRRFLSGQHD